MKQLFLMLVLLGIGISLAPSQIGYAKIDYQANIVIENASVNLHVPSAMDYQSIFYTTHTGHSDSYGSYIPIQGNMTYNSILLVNYSNVRILHDNVMPLRLSGYGSFLASTQKVNTTDSFTSTTTASITQNTNSQLRAMAAIVEWVHNNIEYDDTATDTALVDSNEVLSSQRGSCGELTVLAMAMMRQKGIPTRYVRGYLYTGADFQAHAWGEAYVPSTGWVPFDPTTGEVGALSAGRVAVMTGADPAQTQDTISYSGSDGTFEKTVTLRLIDSYPFPPVAASAAQSVRASPGSVISLNMTIANNWDYYAIPTARFSGSRDLSTTDARIAVISPHTSSVIAWRIAIPSSLGSDYIYTRYVIFDGQGFSVQSVINISGGSGQGSVAELSVSSFDVYLRDEYALVTVSLDNTGNVPVQDAVIKVMGPESTQTQTITLFPGESDSITFSFPVDPYATDIEFNLLAQIGDQSQTLQKIVHRDVAPEQPGPDVGTLLSRNIGNIFIVLVIIIFVLMGLFFLSPMIFRGKRPFSTTIKKRQEKSKPFKRELKYI